MRIKSSNSELRTQNFSPIRNFKIDRPLCKLSMAVFTRSRLKRPIKLETATRSLKRYRNSFSMMVNLIEEAAELLSEGTSLEKLDR